MLNTWCGNFIITLWRRVTIIPLHTWTERHRESKSLPGHWLVNGWAKIKPHVCLTPIPQSSKSWLFWSELNLKIRHSQGGNSLMCWASLVACTFLNMSSFLPVPETKENWYQHNHLHPPRAFQAAQLYKHVQTWTSTSLNSFLWETRKKWFHFLKPIFSLCPDDPTAPSLPVRLQVSYLTLLRLSFFINGDNSSYLWRCCED